MPTIKDLHQLYLSRLETTLDESKLLLQREGGLDGELKTSGWICEQFVRQTLQRFIVPGQFRITSGFIATPDLLRGQDNLPQCDILIVSGNLPPLLSLEGFGIEVVPYESVSGIIEVKRTLTRATVRDNGAFTHLASIIKSIGQTDNLKTDKQPNKFNYAAGFNNYSSDKPLLGVIALSNEMANMNEVINSVNVFDSLVDFVWTFDGHAILPVIQNPGEERFYYYTHTARPETRTWEKLGPSDFQATNSEFYKMFSGPPRWGYFGDSSIPGSNREAFDRAKVFACVIGAVSLMLSRICPRALREEQINNYFLRSG
jgi:hypothetical protein